MKDWSIIVIIVTKTTQIKAVHEGLKYLCNDCEYKATTRSSFLQHDLHDLNCDFCKNKATWMEYLYNHKKKTLQIQLNFVQFYLWKLFLTPSAFHLDIKC